MTQPTPLAAEVAEQVTRLLTEAIAAYHRDEFGARVFDLDQAADRMHMSRRALELGCRRGEIVHTKIGKFRGLTNAQIEMHLASNEVRPDGEASCGEAEEARLRTLQSGARRGRRRAA